MKVLLTGGTGYIGSAVLERLVAGGHHVTAIVRNEKASLQVQDAGAVGIIGDLYDTPWLAAELRLHDGAIHTASPGGADSPVMDDAVVDAAIAAFGGSGEPFIHTGGIWSYGTNARIAETSDRQPPALTSWRAEREQRLLASPVHASVVEPGIVYGNGSGLARLITDGPRTDEGALQLIGSGDQHWTTVHVDDVADLYVRVLESGSTGRWVAVSGDNPTVRELGEAVSAEVAPTSDDSTRERLGAEFADALLLDQQATGEHARRTLGWAPSRPSLVTLLREGYDSN